MAASVIQAKQNSAGSGAVTSIALAFTSNLTAGSYIYVATLHGTNTANLTTLTDTQGNTYTKLDDNTATTGSLLSHFVTNAPVAAGANTVTAHWTSSGFPGICIVEVGGTSGPDLSGTPYHITNTQNSPATSVGAVTTGNMTPSTPAGLLIGVAVDQNINATVSADTTGGYTDLFSAIAFWRFTDSVNHGACESIHYSATTPLPALFTASTSSSTLGTVGVLFADSGVNTLTCAFGSFSLTGEAASLGINTLLAGFGVFTLAGQAANLSQSGNPVELLCAPGVFNLVGASSITNFGFGADFGTFHVVGEPITLGGSGVGLVLDAQQAAFNVQGFPANLVLAGGSAGIIIAQAGGFLLAGQTAILSVSNLPPSSGGVLGKPGGRTIFSAKKVSERVDFIWDFVSSLAPGETILGANITATTYMGNDPSPSSVVGGPAVVTGTKVFQLIINGLIGQIYGVTCTITTNFGQTLAMSAYLCIEPNLP